jgi:hypothetical protein
MGLESNGPIMHRQIDNVSHEGIVGTVGLASSKKGLVKGVICHCSHNIDINL